MPEYAVSDCCSALVWGSSVKHAPQKCGKEHILADEDVVQIVKKFVLLLSLTQFLRIFRI